MCWSPYQVTKQYGSTGEGAKIIFYEKKDIISNNLNNRCDKNIANGYVTLL